MGRVGKNICGPSRGGIATAALIEVLARPARGPLVVCTGRFDGEDLVHGVYFVRTEVEEEFHPLKMITFQK